jgi:hypothetical protein
LIIINLLNGRSAYRTTEVLGIHNTTVYRVAKRFRVVKVGCRAFQVPKRNLFSSLMPRAISFSPTTAKTVSRTSRQKAGAFSGTAGVYRRLDYGDIDGAIDLLGHCHGRTGAAVSEYRLGWGHWVMVRTVDRARLWSGNHC